MRVAVTVWEDTVSTVCDFCSRVLIFDTQKNGAAVPLPMTFTTAIWPLRIGQLKAAGVGVLLCGAVSRPLERLLMSAGIKVVPGICGKVVDVVRAYTEGSLFQDRFTLPGFIAADKGKEGTVRMRCRRSWPGRGKGPCQVAGRKEGCGSQEERKR